MNPAIEFLKWCMSDIWRFLALVVLLLIICLWTALVKGSK